MGKRSEENRERWYYDACTLDEKNIYYEIVNKRPSKEAIISHLSLGEAYSNCHLKKKDPLGTINSLSQFIEELRLGNYIRIVGNDNLEKELDYVLEICSRLSTTDAIHLATAIREKCGVFVSIDSDLLGLPQKKLTKLAKKFNMPKLVVIEMPDRS